ncbi:Uncharacterised protein [Mycobacteroides abscessus subsp. massiliense]|nr:Uncharacterised protein [Mycobacteroides abscessus subsp. massiliense]
MQQVGAGDRPGSEPVAQPIKGAVECQGVFRRIREGQLQLCCTTRVEVGYGESDEGDAPFFDERASVFDKLAGHRQEAFGGRGGSRHGARAGGAGVVAETQS